MFCTNCGQSIPDGSKTCPSCGAVMDERSAAPTPQPKPQPAPQPESASQSPQQPKAQSAPAAKPLGKSRLRGGFVAAGILCLNALLFQLASVLTSYYAVAGKTDFWERLLRQAQSVILAQLPFLVLLFAAMLLFFLPTKRLAFLTAIPRALVLGLALWIIFSDKSVSVVFGHNPLITLGETGKTAELLLKIALAVNALCCVLYLLGTLLPRSGAVIPVLHMILSLGWLGLLGTVSALNIINSYRFEFYPSLIEILAFFSALFFILGHVSALFTLRHAARYA